MGRQSHHWHNLTPSWASLCQPPTDPQNSTSPSQADPLEQEVTEGWNLASGEGIYPLGNSLSTLLKRNKNFNPRGDLALGSGWG